MLHPLRAVMFDAVGTLLVPDPPVVEVYLAAGQRFGSRLPREVIGSRLRGALAQSHGPGSSAVSSPAGERTRWRGIVQDVFPDVPAAGKELFEELWRHFAQVENWRLREGAAEAWKLAEALGLAVGVASNFDERLGEIARRLPPLQHCPHVYWSSQLGYSKPAPEFFQTIETRLGLLPGEILLVGDDPVLDVRAARQVGWQALLVADGQKNLAHVVGAYLRGERTAPA